MFNVKKIQRITKVAEQRDPGVDLEWSLSPLLFWMKVIGFLHDSSFASSNAFYYIGLCCRFFVWICVTAAYFSLFYTAIISNQFLTFLPKKKENGQPEMIPITASWNNLIYETNRTVNTVVIHSIILLFLPKNWNDLKSSLEMCEAGLFGLHRINYRKIRRLVAFGVLYIIFSVIRLSKPFIPSNCFN